MNLSLLDPFHRQIPDRIDSTLSLPRRYHPRRPRIPSKSNSTPTSTRKRNSVISTADSSLDDPSSSSVDNGSSNKSSRGRTLRRKHQQAPNSVTKVQQNDDYDQEFDYNHNNTEEDEIDLHEEQNVWHSCYAVSFNRRGTYLAAGHASGAMGIHDFQSRTLSSIISPPISTPSSNSTATTPKHQQSVQDLTKEDSSHGSSTPNNQKVNFFDPQYDQKMNHSNEVENQQQSSNNYTSPEKVQNQQQTQHQQGQSVFPNGITSITWARRSRTCLLASYGNEYVSLVDNRHPLGPFDVTKKMIKESVIANGNNNGLGGGESKQKLSRSSNSTSPIPNINHTDGLDTTPGMDRDEEGLMDRYHHSQQHDDDELEDSGYRNYNHDHINCWYTLKRTRYITEMKILDPNDFNKPTQRPPTATTNSTTNASSSSRLVDASSEEVIHIHDSDDEYDDEHMRVMVGLMTPIEKQIHLKPMAERTMEERHIHALMKMRLNGSKKSKYERSFKRQKLSPSSQTRRYQNLLIKLPKPLYSSAQIHPHGYGGLACLIDGSLILFGVSPENSFFVKPKNKDGSNHNAGVIESNVQNSNNEAKGKLLYLINSSTGENNEPKGFFVTCATFDPLGHCVYAATKCGTLLGFKLIDALQSKLFGKVLKSKKKSGSTTNERPFFKITIPGGASVNHLVCSNNGSMILTNSRDNTLRLYDTQSLWNSSSKRDHTGQQKPQQPKFSFKDVVSQCKWVSCDFSGDGEFVVGGCNNEESGDKYELYLWNTATGNLLDQLSGPQISLHSLSWHPTRPFIAVGTSDGYVDVWGPRLDWTAFAPDFQALQNNVEYVEKEDEFDTIVDGDKDEMVKRKELSDKIEEQEHVDVTTITPVFDSDSEYEEDVFSFDTKICPNFSGKTPKN